MDEMNENEVDVEEEEKQEEDNILTCPVCGEEVEVGTENCPLCGAPVGTLENNDISGTSIDNSAAIDAMLQSAAMLVEESASLGVGSLDDDVDENDEDEAAADGETENGEEEEPADPMEPTGASAVPSELTADQMNQIQAGGMISLSPGAEPTEEKPAKSKKPPKEKSPKKKDKAAPAPTLYNVDELGNRLPDDVQPEPEEAPAAPPKPKKEAKKKEKKKSAPGVLVVLAAIVALALGCTAGFFAKSMLFPEFPVPECQEFAQRAVKSVNSILERNQELYVAEAYVRDTGDSLQCVFRAFVDSGEDQADSRWFRVKVYKDSPDTVRVYHQLDMAQYEELASSDDQEKQIQASMLMNNQLELERCISEIEKGGIWSTANTTLLNNDLHPFVVEVEEEKPTTTTKKEQTSESAEE